MLILLEMHVALKNNSHGKFLNQLLLVPYKAFKV